MTPPIDPSECSWTPEGSELYEDRRAYIEMLLNIEAEEQDNDELQYPYSLSS